MSRFRYPRRIGSYRRKSVLTDVAVSLVDVAQTRFAADRGGTVFLAGDPGAGQGLVFDHLPPILAQHDQPTLLLRGSMVDGIYRASTSQDQSSRGVISTAAEMTALFASFAGPLGTLLGQIISGMNDTQLFLKELSRDRNSVPTEPRLLQRAIRALADQRPLCFAVENTSPVTASWWLNLIEGLSIEADVDLRLLMILGVEAPTSLPTRDDDGPPLWRLARSLVDGKRAEWRPMPILDEETIGPLIGPSSFELRKRLCTIAGGQAGLTVELFAEWRRRSVITQDLRGLWTFDHAELTEGLAPAKEIIDVRIREVLGKEPALFDKSKQLLALGALQGEIFDLEPIAELLGVETGACERLANRLARNASPGALLEPVAEVMAQKSDHSVRRASRYRFVDRLIWFSLTRYGLSDADRPNSAIKCAASLERIYASDPASIAGTLASLYAHADDVTESNRWRGIANISSTSDLLRWQVKAVIEDEPRWGDLNSDQARRTSRFLLNASVQLSRVRPWDELCSLLEAVEKLATIHSLTTERSAAVRLQGKVYAAAGDYGRARERFTAADRILGPGGDRHERHNLIRELAYLDGLEGDFPRALERLDEAVCVGRECDDIQGQATTLEERGQIKLECGDVDGAHRDLVSALHLYRKAGDSNGIGASLTKLSAVQVVQDHIEGAINSLREALALSQSTGDKARELYARQYLGALVQDHTASYREHQRALTLARELNDAHAEGDSLLSLARAALALRQWDDAARLLQEGFDRDCQIFCV